MGPCSSRRAGVACPGASPGVWQEDASWLRVPHCASRPVLCSLGKAPVPSIDGFFLVPTAPLSPAQRSSRREAAPSLLFFPVSLPPLLFSAERTACISRVNIAPSLGCSIGAGRRCVGLQGRALSEASPFNCSAAWFLGDVVCARVTHTGDEFPAPESSPKHCGLGLGWKLPEQLCGMGTGRPRGPGTEQEEVGASRGWLGS